MRASGLPNKCARWKPRLDTGFSLIELLTVVTITALFLALAAPSFRSFIAGQRVKTASYDLTWMLTQARSEAVKRNTSVLVTPATGGWQNGWTASAGGTLVLQHEAFVDLSIAGPTTGLTYKSSGRLAASVNPFSITSSASTSARCISLDLSGLPSSKAGAC